MTIFKRLVPLLIGFLIPACSAASASAETLRPWWHLTAITVPARLPAEPGAKGLILLTAANLGDATLDAEHAGVSLKAVLPPGLKALAIEAFAGTGGTGLAGNRGPVECEKATLTCTFAGTYPNTLLSGEILPKTLPPYDLIDVRIRVEVREGFQSGESGQFSVTGGETAPASLSRPLAFSSEPAPFGLSDNELSLEEAGGAGGGGPEFQAGSHPYQLTSTIILNQLPGSSLRQTNPVALAKDVSVKLPPGLIGNPVPFPTCTLAHFLTNHVNFGPMGGENDCQPQTAMGVATVIVDEPVFFHESYVPTVPIFNLEPAFGEPARFGFYVPTANTPVLIDTSLRSGPGENLSGGREPDYGVDATVSNITQIAAFLASELTFWGTPGDPRHDNSRGWGCLTESRGGGGHAPCNLSAEPHPPVFMTMPTSCAGPLTSATTVDSWLEPQSPTTFPTTRPMQALDGCAQLSFTPTLAAEPTTDSAASPSGLSVNLNFHDEGLTSGAGIAQSELNKIVVTLPEGFTIDPSAGVGLVGCTPADYARETIDSVPGAGCPNESKLGTVEIETPLLKQHIDGNIFIAQPYENPFPEPAAGHPGGTLVALYIVARNPETGVLVKLAGKVTPNPVTGQLATVFENNPQLPFDHFNFHFREGAQAPLITPATCGTYTTNAQLTPWSEPTTALTDTSSFTITSGSGGGACPAGSVPPFSPGIEAGTLNNNAGDYSPFNLRLTRGDADQEIAGFSTNLPPGLTGDLTGIPFCPNAEIEAARKETGAQFEANPICSASEVGHTLVGTGVGAVLAYVPGKIYLAGPFDGAPFSLVSVTSAKVGPFDLGTVVLRFGLSINPYTAQVSVSPTSSEPIPTIIDGIVTHVRDIRVYIDRQSFIINPTSCTPMAISSTLTASEGASATVSSPFQTASCANLKFAPKFSVSASPAKDTRLDGASLHVNLSYPNAPQGTYANIARVKVELPKQLPSRLTTLRKACTAQQFEANPAGCPSASKIGMAVVHTPILPVPLSGPAIFVSHGGEAFPSLTMVLQGDGVTIDLVGTTFISKAGVTSTTFKTVPDTPFSTFELTLPQGEFSALTALGNLCKQKLTMPTEFLAQNGAEIHEATKVSVTGCPRAKKVKKKKAKHPKRKKR